MTAYATTELDDARIYRLLASLVVPRPIALVSTLSEAGVANIAPFSFYNVAAASPPVLSISVDRRYGRDEKDTVANIRATREFVVNVVSEKIARPMNIASFDWPPEVDEFAAAGLTPDRATLCVHAPRIAESPAQFECRLLQMIELGKWTLILGEIVAFHCDDRLLDERFRIDMDRLQAVGRLTGNEYCRTADRFTLYRSDDSPDKKLSA
jgi:flavin reductase (DIM6/NTAB) family NADH-FMN oxidoreductase RutF